VDDPIGRNASATTTVALGALDGHVGGLVQVRRVAARRPRRAEPYEQCPSGVNCLFYDVVADVGQQTLPCPSNRI